MRKISEKLCPIFDRLKSMILGGSVNANAVSGTHDHINILDTLVEGDISDTLFFPDLHYSDDCRSLWDAERHYRRLKQAIIADNGNLLHLDSDFRNRIIKALRYWVKNDFINPNWWHNQIGVPRNLADITLLMSEYLPDDVYQDLIPIISRGSLGGEYAEKIRRWTGANKIWAAAITVRL